VDTYTLEAHLVVADNPAVDTVAGPALVGVPTDDAAWVATGRAGGALGDAAYEDTTAFDAAGAAAAVRDLFTQSNTVAAGGATQIINPAISAHIVTLTANCAITITAPTYDYVRLRLRTIQGIGGGFSISFTNSVTYDYGTAPVPLTAEANITDYILETLDGGDTWRLALVGDGVSA
jgi:hypothetical protein